MNDKSRVIHRQDARVDSCRAPMLRIIISPFNRNYHQRATATPNWWPEYPRSGSFEARVSNSY